MHKRVLSTERYARKKARSVRTKISAASTSSANVEGNSEEHVLSGECHIEVQTDEEIAHLRTELNTSYDSPQE